VHTRRNFASDLKRFREVFGRRRVDRLKADELQAYLKGLTTSRGGPKRPVSAQTFILTAWSYHRTKTRSASPCSCGVCSLQIGRASCRERVWLKV
jgi:hypothetical protein